jgi:fructosamine-3-kinase
LSTLQNFLLKALQNTVHPGITVSAMQPVGGGCINDAYRVTTSHGQFFIKTNSAKYPQMFEAEAKGLQLLKGANAGIKVPDVIGLYNDGALECLVLEWIPQGQATKQYWQALGEGLAQQHRGTANVFGLNHDNYIGSLSQINTPNPSWVDFYINCRLRPMFEMGIEPLGKELILHFEGLCAKLNHILPGEPPALLHGDLWSGNIMTGENDEPVLFDPAVYYGHREVDIAMTLLFGGFDKEFYSAYNEAYPLQPGWQQRMEIYQLYYLLAHVNLFGSAYVGQVRRILVKY